VHLILKSAAGGARLEHNLKGEKVIKTIKRKRDNHFKIEKKKKKKKKREKRQALLKLNFIQK
jgi:hypothetical protein